MGLEPFRYSGQYNRGKKDTHTHGLKWLKAPSPPPKFSSLPLNKYSIFYAVLSSPINRLSPFFPSFKRPGNQGNIMVYNHKNRKFHEFICPSFPPSPTNTSPARPGSDCWGVADQARRGRERVCLVRIMGYLILSGLFLCQKVYRLYII
jgi:hypothetical protein